MVSLYLFVFFPSLTQMYISRIDVFNGKTSFCRWIDRTRVIGVMAVGPNRLDLYIYMSTRIATWNGSILGASIWAKLF